MILVVDANAVIPNAELQGSTWRDITTAINDGALTVVIPKIVAAEITGRVRKNRRDQKPKSDVHRAPEDVQQAVQNALDEIERWADRYDATIYLEAAGAVIRDTPKVDHDDLAQRAIDRVKPFNDQGGGYRDALHWHTVLEIAREDPTADIVFVSEDRAYQNSGRDDLHPQLRVEAEAILATGTIRLCTTLKEFVPPQKYASEEMRAFPGKKHLNQLVAALFPGGKLHAPELWVALNLEDPVDADVSEPGSPELVWSFSRELVEGGRAYRTRTRLTARVAFDWIDWPDEDDDSSYQELEITAWYSVDDDGFHIDEDRTHLSPAPVFTPAKPFHFETTFTTDAPWTRTAGLFDGWRSQEMASALNSDFFDANAAALASMKLPWGITDSAALLGKMKLPSGITGMVEDLRKMGLTQNVAMVSLASEIAKHQLLSPVADIANELAQKGLSGVPYGTIAAVAAAHAAADRTDGTEDEGAEAEAEAADTDTDTDAESNETLPNTGRDGEDDDEPSEQ